MNHAPTFYWHDYETFGANPKRDRPAQFAGIRTDMDFNPIGDPLVLYCQPTPDFLPHPEACLLTGITPQQAERDGMPEPDFIAAINAEFATPNTCVLGYNNLRFDDEITRYTLYRNFFDPYAREWQNGCSRWDIIDMARLTYALRPDGIHWPKREDGTPSFRLEDLCTANNIAQDQAHDALSDVHATIGLAKLIREKQPKLYDFVLQNKGKNEAGQLLDLQTRTPVVHVSSKFPAALGCLSLVMPLGQHPVNKNAVFVYDLRHDPRELLGLDAEDIRERIFTPTADLPEGIERVAVKAVHLNKCPVLAPRKVLTPDAIQRTQLDIAKCDEHAQWLLAHIAEIQPVVEAAFAHAEFEGSNDAEQALYDGFINNADRKLCDQVRKTSSFELTDWEPPFKDKRLHELFFRYRARHCPDTLNAAEQDEWQNFRHNQIEFAPNGGLTLADYRLMLTALRQQVSGDYDKLLILEQLDDWATRLTR